MSSIKNTLKHFLPRKIYYFLAAIKNRPSSPHSSSAAFEFPESVSDLFVWSPYAKKTYFVAENIRALIKGEKVRVTHFLRFYSRDGAFLREDSHSDDDFFSRIKINGKLDKDHYCSFTHSVHYGVDGEDDFLDEVIKANGELVCEQNRGYCIYYPDSDFSIGSMVHGNFGAISDQGVLLARQRAAHLYTPAYIFEPHNEYDLVFNNPTSRPLDFWVFYNSTNNSLKHSIQSLGTCSVRIVDYLGTLSFESRLPICRPIIFKNPIVRPLLGDFDVLHA